MQPGARSASADLFDRMLRAAKLDVSLYEEVEADTTATRQATLVVLAGAVAAGIGAIAESGLSGLILGTLVAVAGWYLWAFTTYLIGTRLLPEPQTRADLGELLRTIGFSSAPGVLRVLGIIPGLGVPIVAAVNVWMLIAMVVAVRQALDYTSTLRAVAVCVIGWIAYAILFVLAGLLVGR